MLGVARRLRIDIDDGECVGARRLLDIEQGDVG